jgi:hypothetical protein
MIVGIVVGLLLAFLCILITILCCRSRYRRECTEDPDASLSLKSRRILWLPFQKKSRGHYTWSIGYDEGDTTFVSEMIAGPPKVSLNFSAEKLNADDAKSFKSRFSRKLSQRMKRNSKSSLMSFDPPNAFRFHKGTRIMKHNSEEGRVYQRMLQSPIQRNEQEMDEIDRTPYAESPSVAQSVDTDILMEGYEDEPDVITPIRNVPRSPSHIIQLPVRNQLYNASRQSHITDRAIRPVPRRGPQHSSFFAGGSRRRKNAPNFGHVLSTIDGSPEAALDEFGNYLPGQHSSHFKNDGTHSSKLTRNPTQSTTRDWDTVASGDSPPSKRQGNQRRWSSLSRDYSRYASPRRDNVHGQRSNANTWYGEPRDYGYGDISGSSSVYSWSPPRGSSSVLDLTHTLDVNVLQSKLERQVPIMERPRAAYRLNGRSPFATLSGNAQRDPVKLLQKDSLKVVYGEHGQRPVSHEGRGINSLRGRTVRGNEAFI